MEIVIVALLCLILFSIPSLGSIRSSLAEIIGILKSQPDRHANDGIIDARYHSLGEYTAYYICKNCGIANKIGAMPLGTPMKQHITEHDIKCTNCNCTLGD